MLAMILPLSLMKLVMHFLAQRRSNKGGRYVAVVELGGGRRDWGGDGAEWEEWL